MSSIEVIVGHGGGVVRNRLVDTALIVLVATVGLNTAVAEPVRWTPVREDTVRQLNSDIRQGRLTADVGVYYPSNLDSTFVETYPMETLIEDFKGAKEIFGAVDVQLNLLWIKTGEIDPRYFEIRANDLAGASPGSRHVNMYVDSWRERSEITREALEAFESIIEKSPDNSRTVYLVVLPGVYMSFFEQLDERTWAPRTIATGGLSFPSYSYPDIPRRIRGVITVNKTYPERSVIAHELGHKLINVSHEYRDVDPQHEVRAEGGLMLYGSGTEIPSGKAGRWHKERLHLSPYLYREDRTGNRQWNADYAERGHYYDPIYGNKVIHFRPTASEE